jgi:hypothetical protein
MALGTVKNSVNIIVTCLLELNFYAQNISLIFLQYSATYFTSKVFVSPLHLQHVQYGVMRECRPVIMCYILQQLPSIVMSSSQQFTYVKNWIVLGVLLKVNYV